MNSIQAISFDVGGTLIEPWPSVGQVYASVAARHGFTADPDQLNDHFARAWSSKGEFDYSRAAWSRLVSFAFCGPMEPAPEMPFFDELYDRFAAADVWRIYDDVAPAFDALLSRGLKLAVTSNWDERLRPLLKLLKLDRYFDVITVSCEVGFQKPSPVIFQETLRKLGLPAAAVLHVGDSASEDVGGARSAGLASIQLNRRNKLSDAKEIGSLSELISVTTALSRVHHRAD